MSDLVERLRYTASIRERHRLDSDNDPIRLECLEAADRIEQLEAENASLATWQCEFTDGKTGLVYGQGGTTFCIMAKRMQQLEAEVKVWQGHAKTAIWSDSEECKFLTARIEQLETALDILQAAMTAKKPIPMAFKKAILEARAALKVGS